MEFSLKNTAGILTWLICLTYAGLFFPIRISNIFLTILLIFCVLHTDPKEIIRALKENTFFKIILAMYLLQIIGLLYTSNLKTGFFMLEKKIHFLLIPLFVLPLLQKINGSAHTLIKRLGLITMMSSVVLLSIALYKTFVLNDPLAFHYGRNLSEGFTSIHYPYYSMYFACGSLLLIDSLIEPLLRKKYGLLCIILLLIYSLGIMILVASKTGIVAFGIASMVILYYKLPNKKLLTISVLLLLLAAAILLYFNDTTRNRFIGLDKHLSMLTKDVLIEDIPFTGLNMRLLFWKLQLIHSSHDNLLLTGVGTGDAQDYIDSIYNLPIYQLYGYLGWDSHNQWVYTLIQLGVLGVILIALLYLKYFKEAFKRSDLKLVIVLIITLSFSLTESILELNKGIIFFSLLFTVLSSPYNKTSVLSKHFQNEQINK